MKESLNHINEPPKNGSQPESSTENGYPKSGQTRDEIAMQRGFKDWNEFDKERQQTGKNYETGDNDCGAIE